MKDKLIAFKRVNRLLIWIKPGWQCNPRDFEIQQCRNQFNVNCKPFLFECLKMKTQKK